VSDGDLEGVEGRCAQGWWWIWRGFVGESKVSDEQ